MLKLSITQGRKSWLNHKYIRIYDQSGPVPQCISLSQHLTENVSEIGKQRKSKKRASLLANLQKIREGCGLRTRNGCEVGSDRYIL